jgi:hypothetical protein
MRDLPYYTKGKISLLTQTTEKYLISVLFVEADYHHTRVSIYLSQKYEKIFQTLKRLMLGEGFPHLSAYTGPMTTELNGVFNCSYTPALMSNYVYSRWNYVNSDLPIINKNLITNKLEAQRRMEGEGVGEHILVWRRQEPSFADHNREPDRWVIKPYASQGGAGIRTYEGGRLNSHFYLQKKVNKVREFRAHVGLWLNNPVFTIQEKKPKPELWESLEASNEVWFGDYRWPINEEERSFFPLTWNINSGFYLRRSTTPWNREEKVNRFGLYRRIEEVAVKAVKALGYQYGAVDMLMDDNRWLWVVEINSHPAIKNPTSKEVYIEALEPLKTMSRRDLFTLTRQTEQGTIRRTMTRGA